MPSLSPSPVHELVSIVIPTKDRLPLLRETLASVQSQHHLRWEAIVVDDGSSDGTVPYVESLAVNDARIRCLPRRQHREKSGAQVCRNVGLTHARGDHVLFLDSDDLLAPHCLAGRLAVLQRDPGLNFVVGQCQLFDHQARDFDRLWAKWEPNQDDLDAFLGLGRIPWQTSGPLWRRTALDRIGPWDEELVSAGHDHEFHVRALCLGLTYCKQDEVDYYWRRPRSDSYSSFDAFKRHHATGAMILAYRHSVRAVVRHGRLTPARQKQLSLEAVWLGQSCRLYGGSRTVATEAVNEARRLRLLGPTVRLEVALMLSLWPLRLGRRIPAMAYLNLRFPRGTSSFS